MKVLVATRRGQGKRKNDFCWATEGELVKFAFECDGERVDGRCGCRRSMSGFDTFKGTTTFTIAELTLSRADFIAALKASDTRAGWAPTDKDTEDRADELLRVAKMAPVGTILEKRGAKILSR